MADSAAPALGGSSPRGLIALTLTVVAAHVAVLWSSPHWLQASPDTEPAAPGPTAFSTRMLPPAATAAAAPPAAPKPPPKATRPKNKPNQAQASASRSDTAINSEANLPATPQPEPPAPAVEPPPAAPVAEAPPPPEPVAPEPAAPAAPPEFASGSLPTQVPPSIRLEYDVSGLVRRLPYQANGEMSWRHDGQQYEAQASVSAFLVGGRTQRSQGAITPQGLMPRRFSDKARSEYAAHFDADQGRVIFSANTPQAPLEPGMQDRLSLFMQLAAMVQQQPERFVPGTRVSVPTVSAREADHWVFTVEGPETLNLPTGPEATLKLLRVPRREYDTRVELWLAPSIHHLPARIRITQANGDYADQQLRRSAPP